MPLLFDSLRVARACSCVGPGRTARLVAGSGWWLVRASNVRKSCSGNHAEFASTFSKLIKSSWSNHGKPCLKLKIGRPRYPHTRVRIRSVCDWSLALHAIFEDEIYFVALTSPTFSIHFSIHFLPTFLPTFLTTYLTTYLPTFSDHFLPTFLTTFLPTFYPQLALVGLYIKWPVLYCKCKILIIRLAVFFFRYLISFILQK